MTIWKRIISPATKKSLSVITIGSSIAAMRIRLITFIPTRMRESIMARITSRIMTINSIRFRRPANRTFWVSFLLSSRLMIEWLPLNGPHSTIVLTIASISAHFQAASVRKRAFMMKHPQLPVNCHSTIMNSDKSLFMVKDILLMIPLGTQIVLLFFSPISAAISTTHEHKSNVTSTEKTLTFPINQTTHKSDDAKQHDVIPDFKKISRNFTSFIDDLLHGNVLEQTSVKVSTASTTTTLAPQPSTSKPIKSIINDDDFIIKHLRAPTVTAVKSAQGVMEIFSKQTLPTMNGLLKLAGCNIYGVMYKTGQIIAELSNACLECKCLPDIGVGCSPKC